MPERFDQAYFEQFYEARRTRVRTYAEAADTARGVTALVEWLMGDIASVLEVGAGAGHWRDWFKRHRKTIPYRSTDVSAHACKRYGHERRDITRWRVRERYDLVVCIGVLTYLDDDACTRAIENIAAMTATFLFVEIETKKDLATLYTDPRTDPALLRRTAAWYRKRLEKHFIQLAFGLWVRRDVGLSLGELERGR
jgi:hypothetical protein